MNKWYDDEEKNMMMKKWNDDEEMIRRWRNDKIIDKWYDDE